MVALCSAVENREQRTETPGSYFTLASRPTQAKHAQSAVPP